MTKDRIAEFRKQAEKATFYPNQMVRANGLAITELLDEVERQAKEIAELEEHEVDQCERAAEMLIAKDREIAEWKRVAENNTQGMIGQKAIIDGFKDKCIVCGKNKDECDGSL